MKLLKKLLSAVLVLTALAAAALAVFVILDERSRRRYLQVEAVGEE